MEKAPNLLKRMLEPEGESIPEMTSQWDRFEFFDNQEDFEEDQRYND